MSMKKIDFHIHTIPTDVDAAFEFDLGKLSEYVDVMELDGIAITNHNIFDLAQFNTISSALDIVVLPGIEINLGKGHVLLISNIDGLDDFTAKCSKVSGLIKSTSDTITAQVLREIFGDLSRYLVIPHYSKDPIIDQASVDQLGSDFIVGEVASAKKFIYALKDADSPTPVLFSDDRATLDWDFKTRQTYLDVSSVDIQSIRRCLTDKNKVSLSREDGNRLIQVTPEGIKISSGLTVILGGRSSGKSYTLDQINKFNDNVKYIRQFKLIEMDPQKEAETFNERIGKRRQENAEKYLLQFRGVVDEIKNISLSNDDKRMGDYITSLLKSASETERQDLYSKTAMFSETGLRIDENEKLESLISATQELLNPGKYAELVESKVSRKDFVGLLYGLIGKYCEEALTKKKREWTNTVVGNIKNVLASVSAVTEVKDINFLELAKNKAKVAKFVEIAKEIQKPRTIGEKKVRKFTIEERSVGINGAQDLKDINGHKGKFMDAFGRYNDPYEFLLAVMEIEEIDPTAYYKFFVKIEYNILNEYGAPVSGGERAEFRLINEIDGAINYDFLLIDEPESSFDNLFLSTEVNQIIKEIAKNTPVVVVTHNNTVGASIRPDYLIYTERRIVSGIPQYHVYAGLATDNNLTSADGQIIRSSEVAYKYLEAGKEQYQERKKIYEMLEN